MDMQKLYEILEETTVLLRNGPVVHGTPELVDAINRGDEELPGGVVTIDAMPAAADAAPELHKTDMVLVSVGVDMAKAEACRGELVEILNQYPDPERLSGGPSYIEVGAQIGDQGAAFRLFALGEALKIWQVITPLTFGMEGKEAEFAAGRGYVMISGYRKGES